jgi:hypothetical protein
MAGLLAVPSISLRSFPMTALRQRMLEDMQVRNLSPHTQSSYILQVSLLSLLSNDGFFVLLCAPVMIEHAV